MAVANCLDQTHARHRQEHALVRTESWKNAGFGNFRRLKLPYARFMEDEGVPMHRGIGFRQPAPGCPDAPEFINGAVAVGTDSGSGVILRAVAAQLSSEHMEPLQEYSRQLRNEIFGPRNQRLNDCRRRRRAAFCSYTNYIVNWNAWFRIPLPMNAVCVRMLLVATEA